MHEAQPQHVRVYIEISCIFFLLNLFLQISYYFLCFNIMFFFLNFFFFVFVLFVFCLGKIYVFMLNLSSCHCWVALITIAPFYKMWKLFVYLSVCVFLFFSGFFFVIFWYGTNEKPFYYTIQLENMYIYIYEYMYIYYLFIIIMIKLMIRQTIWAKY